MSRLHSMSRFDDSDVPSNIHGNESDFCSECGAKLTRSEMDSGLGVCDECRYPYPPIIED